MFLYSEVCKALNKTRGLYQRWGELQQEQEGTGGGTAGAGIVVGSREELDWTNTELRNALRSIEWDLEDLEETIDILFTLQIRMQSIIILFFFSI